MASRREPPRPSEHSPSCPAYSPSAKYSSCTCGLTTPRKSKRPTIEEATENALAVDQAVLEAEKKSVDQRALMEAVINGTGTLEQQGARRDLEQKGISPVLAAAAVSARAPADAVRHDPVGVLVDAIAAGDFDDDPAEELESAADEHFAEIIAIGKDQRRLDLIADAVSSMSQRLVALRHARTNTPFDRPTTIEVGEPDTWPVEIHQVCGACREQHFATLTIDTQAHFESIGAIGLAARKARIRHRCPTISDQIPASMTKAELDQLAHELEADATRLGQRYIDVQKLAAERTS